MRALDDSASFSQFTPAQQRQIVHAWRINPGHIILAQIGMTNKTAEALVRGGLWHSFTTGSGRHRFAFTEKGSAGVLSLGKAVEK